MSAGRLSRICPGNGFYKDFDIDGFGISTSRMIGVASYLPYTFPFISSLFPALALDFLGT